jgi:diguanylate cyclase (GGDEF)-like protein
MSDQRTLLLIGRPDGRLDASARRHGWSLRPSPTPFAALETVGDNGEAPVLLDVEAVHPRTDALVRALRTASPSLRIYLLAPPHLEPEARRAVGGDPSADYLISPLDNADWRAIEARAPAPDAERQAEAPPPAIETTDERDSDNTLRPPRDALDLLGATAMLLENMDQSPEQMLPAAARWASEMLDGAPVRIRWASRTASYPSRGPRPASALILPLTSLESGGTLEVDRDAAPDRARGEKVAAALTRLLGHRSQFASYRQMAFTDYLSGARNRRYLIHEAEQLIDRSRREGFPLTLLVFDIDDFKHYNDQYGHPAGDGIIRDVVKLMRQCTRPQDIVARIGGDEFAVLLWDAGPPRHPGSQHPEQAAAVIKRFRRALADHDFQWLGPEARGVLTISGGLARYPDDASDVAGLLARAAAGLKTAKREGKDRIYLIGPDTAEPHSF